MTARAKTAAPTPMRVERHWRVTPTASTIVSASTNSTTEARNAGTAATSVCIGSPWGGSHSCGIESSARQVSAADGDGQADPSGATDPPGRLRR